MKNLVKYCLVTSLLLGGAACTNLDEQIKGDFTKQEALLNKGVGEKNNVNKATPNDGLTGAFTRVLNGTAGHNSYFSVQEVSTDEAVITQKGGDWFDGGIWLNMHKHAFSSTVGGINNAWNDANAGIFQCNDLLSKTQTAGNVAQLRTLRAYFFWRLLDVFGRVPLATSTAKFPQSERPVVYAFVESELLAALPDLPSGKQEYARFNKSGANALLARLYLNANIYKGTAPDNADYDKAIAAADAVINSGLYTITGIKYKDVFSPSNVENAEHIFVAPFDEATGQGMNLAQMTLHYPSQLTFKLAEQPWNGYSTLEEFYNSYEAADERKANNFIAGPQLDVNGSPILDLAFDKGDEDGAAINYTPKINMLSPNGSRQAGARLGKFSFKLGQFQNMDNDYPLLRYGEVLLNKAEALARKNGYGDATALALVNQIRTRAGAPTFSTLTAGTLLAERGRELFIESLRRTDLIRFGNWGNAWWEKPAHSDGFKNLMPIPLEQINATSGDGANKLTQNPGYQ
jgi:starch-binding outer membrane protein, SusD/RagB family